MQARSPQLTSIDLALAALSCWAGGLTAWRAGLPWASSPVRRPTRPVAPGRVSRGKWPVAPLDSTGPAATHKHRLRQRHPRFQWAARGPAGLAAGRAVRALLGARSGGTGQGRCALASKSKKRGVVWGGPMPPGRAHLPVDLARRPSCAAQSPRRDRSIDSIELKLRMHVASIEGTFERRPRRNKKRERRKEE